MVSLYKICVKRDLNAENKQYNNLKPVQKMLRNFFCYFANARGPSIEKDNLFSEQREGIPL